MVIVWVFTVKIIPKYIPITSSHVKFDISKDISKQIGIHFSTNYFMKQQTCTEKDDQKGPESQEAIWSLPVFTNHSVCNVQMSIN